MDVIASHNAPRVKGVSRSMLLGMVILAAMPLIVKDALADWSTPFMEINNKVGDVSEAHGFVVALGHKVEDCKYYLVIVTTDCMEHIVIKATADKDVVKESLLGRPAIIKAEVVNRKEDPKTKRVVVQLKIVSVRSSKKQKGGCGVIETPQEAVSRVGAKTLVQGVLMTQKSVVTAMNRSDTPVDGHAKIARTHWAPSVHALKPKYVYFDGVNIVIILQTSAHGESGLYVEHPFASSGFNAHREKGESNIWSGTLIANSIYAVTRKGKHNKEIQTTN